MKNQIRYVEVINDNMGNLKYVAMYWSGVKRKYTDNVPQSVLNFIKKAKPDSVQHNCVTYCI